MTNTKLDNSHATTEGHPITPPLELRAQWIEKAADQFGHFYEYIVDQAALWGYEQRGAVNEAELQKARDEELEACKKALRKIWEMDHVSTVDDFLRELRAARRPKPPSLKEQAQHILVENGTTIDGRIELDPNDIDIIRRALQTLPD